MNETFPSIDLVSPFVQSGEEREISFANLLSKKIAVATCDLFTHNHSAGKPSASITFKCVENGQAIEDGLSPFSVSSAQRCGMGGIVLEPEFEKYVKATIQLFFRYDQTAEILLERLCKAGLEFED